MLSSTPDPQNTDTNEINVGVTLLFVIVTKNASFRSYGTFAYLLGAHICNINMCMYVHNIHGENFYNPDFH